MFQIPSLRAKSHGKSNKRSYKRLPNTYRTRRLRHEPLEERQLLAVYSSSPDVPIPDPGTITSEISVSDAGVIQDLDVQLTIEHTKAEDLDVYLIAPDGTRVELFTDVGGRGDNFIGTTLDDEAGTSVAAASVPFTGTFRPEGDLSVVDGSNVAGIWTLEVTDDKNRESGVLKNWAISVEIAGTPSGDFIDNNPTMLGNAGGDYIQGQYFGKDVVVADNGDAMAVWQESEGAGDSGPWRAMAAEYHAATDTWDTPVVISELTTPYDIMNWLRLAGDGRGNYVAAWQQETSSAFEVWVNVYDADLGWLGSETIGTGTTDSYDPEIAVAYDSAVGETKAVVAWGYDDNVLISRLTGFSQGNSQGVWSTPDVAGDVADRLNPLSTVIDMAADGDFLMLFQTVDTYDLYYRHYDWDAGWTGSIALLETLSEVTSLPDVAMNDSGIAMASWMQRTGEGEDFELWARRWNGSGWETDPEMIADALDNGVMRNASVAISDNGESVVLWRQYRDGSTVRNAYVRHHDGTQWTTIDGTPEIIQLNDETLGDVGAGASNSAMGPNLSMAMDDAGNAIASWTQDDGTDINLWAARFDRASSTWVTAEKIEDAPLDALRPVVAMNGAGDNQIIWTQSDGALNHIYTVTVPEPGNLPPTAVDDSGSTNEDAPVSINILANDSDPDTGDVIQVSDITQGADGTVTNNGDSVTYEPNADFNGTDTFTYTISDGNGGFDTATVTVNVIAQPDAPVAVDDAVSTTEGTPVTGNVLDNDTDADGDTLFAALATNPTGGSVTLNTDGSFTYTPDTGTTSDTFTYTVSDGNGGTDVGAVSITVSTASTNTLYVYDIRFESKRGNKDWRAVFEIRSDSDEDGEGTAADEVAAGVWIQVEFDGVIYEGTTDADGVFRTNWIKDLGSGDYEAEVVDLVLADFDWNPLTLDLEGDSDDDGKPDDLLSL